jgi:transketolase
MSVAYAQAGVRIVGTHAGVGIGDDGHSQMGLEDLSLMRVLPQMIVLQPADEIETRQMIDFLCTQELQRPAYLRLTRQALAPVHDANYRFQLGAIDILKRSKSSVALLATGGTVQECMNVKAECTIVNVPSLKPFDTKGVLELAKDHKVLITVEDHYTTGGLGSAVAEVIAESKNDLDVKLIRLGVQDQFGESGEGFELYEKFGISTAKIQSIVQKFL